MNTPDPIPRFRRRYGASPLHLAAHLVAFAVVAFAVDRIFTGGSIKVLVALYVGIALAHDLVFLPAYSALDRLVRTCVGRLPRWELFEVPLINHLRAPAVVSAMLLIIYAPLIVGHDDQAHFDLTGLHLDGYLRNWLLITVGLFALSGVVYAVRVGRAAMRRRARA
jgi:hypothetical protein